MSLIHFTPALRSFPTSTIQEIERYIKSPNLIASCLITRLLVSNLFITTILESIIEFTRALTTLTFVATKIVIEGFDPESITKKSSFIAFTSHIKKTMSCLTILLFNAPSILIDPGKASSCYIRYGLIQEKELYPNLFNRFPLDYVWKHKLAVSGVASTLLVTSLFFHIVQQSKPKDPRYPSHPTDPLKTDEQDPLERPSEVTHEQQRRTWRASEIQKRSQIFTPHLITARLPDDRNSGLIPLFQNPAEFTHHPQTCSHPQSNRLIWILLPVKMILLIAYIADRTLGSEQVQNLQPIRPLSRLLPSQHTPLLPTPSSPLLETNNLPSENLTLEIDQLKEMFKEGKQNKNKIKKEKRKLKLQLQEFLQNCWDEDENNSPVPQITEIALPPRSSLSQFSNPSTPARGEEKKLNIVLNTEEAEKRRR